MNKLAFFSMTLLAACGSDTICGDGTTKMGNTCVGGSGSGNDTTCGAGTHLEGTTCVPDGAAAHGAPTITAITPPDSGIAGVVQFEITGTNFAGDDVNGLTVDFGGIPVEPASIVASETSIAGTIPAGITQTGVVINAPVTVTTNKGSAQTAFQYDALFAVDGIGFDGTTPGGELWLMDPFLGLFADWGTLQDAGGSSVGMIGITFDSTGVLYGVTNETNPRLVTIDLKTAMYTPVGALKAGSTVYSVTGIKFSGTTLYAWGSAASSSTSGLLSINTTTGAVTEIGTQTQPSTWGGGLAVDGTGTLFVSNDGAGADAFFSGALNQVNTTTGAVTMMATLDYYIGAPVTAMSFLGNGMFAAIDDGSYGAATFGPQTGVTLANIDMTQTQIVAPWYELPAITSVPSHVTSMDFAPATLTIARTKPTTWSKAGAPSRH
jgi:hypothetical protein